MNELIVFGESIWDLFEDGRKCLGGSGLNLAWHLRGVDQDCHFISRIGRDDNGKEILQRISDWGISSTQIQIDDNQPTAYLDVILDEDGGHQYPSPPEHALDFIEFQEGWLDFPRTSLMYHGTYMLRHQTTRDTIARMKKAGFRAFLDMNLRENYWSHDLLDLWLQDIAYLKMSDQEFEMWKPGLGLCVEGQIKVIQSFMQDHNIEHVLFTIGPGGSIVITKHDMVVQKPADTVVIQNTVGAGDAYCAGFICGVLTNQSLQACAHLGTRLAEQICQVNSATSTDKALYKTFRDTYL